MAPPLLCKRNSLRECCSITAERNCENASNRVTSPEKWHMIYRISERSFIMARHTSRGIESAPMFLLSVNPAQNLTTPPENLPDKLKYYRQKAGLTQKEVADKLGIDRNTYSRYELPTRERYPEEKLKALAELYGLTQNELSDGYNEFLKNQGNIISEKRSDLGLTQKEFAEQIGTKLANLKRWERGEVAVSRDMWEKCFK